MGAPGPQSPATNAYRVHFLSPAMAARAVTFLRDLKISSRIVEGCTPAFFEATVCIVGAEDLAGLEKRPFGNALLLCLGNGIPKPGLGEKIAWPDLWIVEGDGDGGDETAVASNWIRVGAGAVAVTGTEGAHWESRNGAFGQSRGVFQKSGVKGSLEDFTAGLLHGLLEELLGETLFDKTGKDLDRECLEMRPLRLGRAVQAGRAAQTGEGIEWVRHQLRVWRGPVPQSWGGRTR